MTNMTNMTNKTDKNILKFIQKINSICDNSIGSNDIYYDDNEIIFIKPCNYHEYDNPKKQLFFTYNKDSNTFLVNGDKDLEIVTEEISPLYNEWIYGMNNAFIVRNKNLYKILIIDYADSNKMKNMIDKAKNLYG